MSRINDFIEFKKHEINYAPWKEERENKMNKKVAYLKNNSVSKDEFNHELERAKVVLNAVNVMDEYSQTKAENMEVSTDGVTTMLNEVGFYGSTGIGLLLLKFSKTTKEAFKELKQGNLKHIYKLFPAALAILAPTIIVSSITSFWSARKQMEASREGRSQAMENDLKSLNQFAILDEKQKNEVKKIAPTIEVSDKEAKSEINEVPKLNLKAQEQFKNIDIKNINLNPEEALQAKKDKDLIQNIVEKIDISSQDYAENAELVTSTINAVALSSGGIGGVALNKLLTKTKLPNKLSKLASVAVGIALYLTGVIMSAKIEKQASRVGRFKAKQELLNNPEQIIYVEEEKYANTPASKVQHKKKNFFANIIQVFKDNKKYNDYIKSNNKTQIQERKAKDQIKLTDEQEKRASQLQKNVFNMFNKLDDKSQSYSEATEALGDVANDTISLITSLPMLLVPTIKTSGVKKVAIMSLSIISGILMNILITKEQRKASRVANMQAIKELDDYRYFAHNDTKNTQSKEETKNKIQKKNFSMQEFMNKTN